ncbi:MAG TPA: RnfABCDGE type electron transport complex subunit D [Cyclobacteriaceae bacterium]
MSTTATTIFKVAPSPHIHTELTVPQIMRGVIIAMMPALLISIYNFGVGAVYVTAVSVLSCMVFEYVFTRYLLKRATSLADGSAMITGILLAFNVPTNLPWWIIVIGALVSVGIGKLCFGGLGNNPFNPALVGRVFMLVSFPVQMTSWPKPEATWSIDAATGATPLGILKDGLREGKDISSLMGEMPALSDIFLGFQGGSLGEMSALAMLIGLIYMLYRKIISWHVPVSILLTVFTLTSIFWLIDPTQFASPLFHLLTGGLMLGAVFMATDYVTSPITHKGMIIFGVGIGLITVLIRLFGSYPEGVSFGILIMNGFVPLINRHIKPRRFGAK